MFLSLTKLYFIPVVPTANIITAIQIVAEVPKPCSLLLQTF